MANSFPLLRRALEHLSSVTWLLIHTVAEMRDAISRGRVPFQLPRFFAQCDRVGFGSVPLVLLVAFFLGLTMALLTGCQLRLFGQERLVPPLGEFRQFGIQLNELSGPQSALRQSLSNFEELSAKNGKLDLALSHFEELLGPEGALAQTFKNSEILTRDLARNPDLPAAIKNVRAVSSGLKRTVDTLSPQLNVVGRNLEQASDTVKRQPWRLIWPGTKKYP